MNGVYVHIYTIMVPEIFYGVIFTVGGSVCFDPCHPEAFCRLGPLSKDLNFAIVLP